MKILMTGATGFIGSAIAKYLRSIGHELVICVRDITFANSQFPDSTISFLDAKKAVHPEFWLKKLKDLDVIINCMGVLNEKQQALIHVEIPKALFIAAKQMNIKLIIQISALGVEQGETMYAKTKKTADDFLLSLKAPAVILQPSLVYASGSYGGTSLFRALSSLPWFIPVVGNGKQLFQPIAMQELTLAIANLIERPPTYPIVLKAVGIERISLVELLMDLRSWLGFKKARAMAIPKIIIKSICKIGSFIKSPVINMTSYQMLLQNNIAKDAELQEFIYITQVEPKKFKENLFFMPSYVQDRWHARLYFLRPLLRFSIGLTWIFSGIFSLISYNASVSFLSKITDLSSFAGVLVIVASCIDIILGLCTLTNFQLKKISMFQIGFILFYTLMLSIFLPILWLDPFGAILKNGVIIIATLILLSINELR